MFNFFESTHCKSKAHCATCRDLENGRKWRINVNGENNPDFECPVGLPWTAMPVKKVRTFFISLYEEILEEYKDPWLLSMAAQCKEAYNNPPKDLTCKSKKHYKNRWYKKLKYYRKEMKNEKATA